MHQAKPSYSQDLPLQYKNDDGKRQIYVIHLLKQHELFYTGITYTLSIGHFASKSLPLYFQATFVEQMKGQKKTDESFQHAVGPLEKGIYPITLKLPSNGTLQEKQTLIGT